MAGTIKAVIFDWAGTVIDFGSCAPVDAMKQAFAAEQVSVTDAIVRRHMGRAKRDHINAILSESEVAAAWTDAHGSEVGEAGVDRIFAALEPLMIDAAAAHALLIPGAADTVAGLRDQKIRIGSCTGYTRAMMAPVQSRAAQQGYAPDVLVCADDTVEGRPSPLMVWKNLVELGVWPASSVIKVDDAEVGMAEGRSAGCITVGVAASGNLMALDLEAYQALISDDREARLAAVRDRLFAAGADYVIDTVASLPQLIDELSH
jgi:phosphonoacetaldehyde hydrolase